MDMDCKFSNTKIFRHLILDHNLAANNDNRNKSIIQQECKVQNKWFQTLKEGEWRGKMLRSDIPSSTFSFDLIIYLFMSRIY
jgi:hypothetical protein